MNSAILVDGAVWIVDGTTLRVIRRKGVTHHTLRPLHVRTTLELRIDATRRRPVAVVTVRNDDTTTTHLADIELDRDTFRLVDVHDNYRQREIEFVPADDFEDNDASQLAWMLLHVLTGTDIRHHSLEYDPLMQYRLHVESRRNNPLRRIRLSSMDGRELLRTRDVIDHISVYARGDYYFLASDGSYYYTSERPVSAEALRIHYRSCRDRMRYTTVAGRTYYLHRDRNDVQICELDLEYGRYFLTAKVHPEAVVEGFTVSPSESVVLHLTRTRKGVRKWGIRVLYPFVPRVPRLVDLCVRHVERSNLDLSSLPVELIDRVRGLV